MAQEFARKSADPSLLLDSGWRNLPAARSQRRREPNQGMTAATNSLAGAPPTGFSKATDYAHWLKGLGLNPCHATNWEWCHLIAHSFGGGGGAANIVAAPCDNNTEQMAIENTLYLYRRERGMGFRVRVSAVRCGAGQDRFLGDIIRYRIRSDNTGMTFDYYLDCKPGRSSMPSARFHQVKYLIARWMNQQIMSAYDHGGTRVSRDIRRRLQLMY